jgi:hypothetical protein
MSSPFTPAEYPIVLETSTRSCLNFKLFTDTPAVPDHLNCAFAAGAAKQRARISKIELNSLFIFFGIS